MITILQNDLTFTALHQQRVLLDIVDEEWEKDKLPLDGTLELLPPLSLFWTIAPAVYLEFLVLMR